MPSSLQLHRANDIARLELTGDDGLPRLESSLLDALDEHLTRLFPDPACRALVLHGTEKCFAAGADLSQIVRLHGVEAFDFARRGQMLYQRIARAPKPVVAAISGYCMGGAWDLAMACHARLCTPGTTFRHPGPTVGIFSGWGGTQRLPRFLGPARAYALLLEGKKMTPPMALAWGLVEEVVEASVLLERAMSLAADLAKATPPL